MHHVKQNDFAAKSVFEYSVVFLNKSQSMRFIYMTTMLLVQTEVVPGWSLKTVHVWHNKNHWSHGWLATKRILSVCLWLLFVCAYDFSLIQRALSSCKWNAKFVVCLEQHPKFHIQITAIPNCPFCWKWKTCKTGPYVQCRKQQFYYTILFYFKYK